MQHYDIAIIGAGAMGSATAYHLCSSGRKILVLDRHVPPHHLGSSHGESRIIREAYFEHPMYVPLVRQSYALWNQLEQESGKTLFLKTGGLMIGDRNHKLFRGAAQSAAAHHVPVELLNREQLQARYPVFRPDKDMAALLELNAGILFPELCIETQIALARASGVQFNFNETALQLERKQDSITIVTEQNRYTAGKLILAAGAWMTSLLPELKLPLEVKRQVLHWFNYAETDTAKFDPQHFPIFIWEHRPDYLFYGFPDLGHGFKVAIHHRGMQTTADAIDRNVYEEEIAEISSLVHRYFNATLAYRNSAVCMYTNTPDEHFIIDHHPDCDDILIASACSGHGFKFSSAIGKILADLALDQLPDFDIRAFRMNRTM